MKSGGQERTEILKGQLDLFSQLAEDQKVILLEMAKNLLKEETERVFDNGSGSKVNGD